MNAQMFEKCVAYALQKPRPPRKFEIDQVVGQGLIVGYYFISVAQAFNEWAYPGWYYVVEANYEQHHYLESDIELVDNVA